MSAPEMEVETFREKRVRMAWSISEAPVMKKSSWSDRDVSLVSLYVTQQQGRDPQVKNVRGTYFKKDGSPGKQEASMHVWRLGDLPDEVQALVRDALEGVAW